METVRRAALWEGLPDKDVRCSLCSHRCRIPEGRAGLCGVRENRGGELQTLVYGRLVARSVDPIEKKPFFHVSPGSSSYSIATAGCNMRCAHCQNFSISQVQRDRGTLPGRYTPAAGVVQAAVEEHCGSIAYTYTEPTVFFEYASECMRLAREAGLLNLFVTNGYMTGECIDAVAPHLDGANVDLKAMTEEFYRRICGARLQPVLDSIRELRRRRVWVEVTTLVIPHHNDSPGELRELARFLVSVSPDIPWHVTGFYPTYRLTGEAPTPYSSLNRAREIGFEEGLRFVYAGNRAGRGGEDTVCPGCKSKVIGRVGFSVTEANITQDGRCGRCGQLIPGVAIGGAHELFEDPHPIGRL